MVTRREIPVTESVESSSFAFTAVTGLDLKILVVRGSSSTVVMLFLPLPTTLPELAKSIESEHFSSLSASASLFCYLSNFYANAVELFIALYS